MPWAHQIHISHDRMCLTIKKDNLTTNGSNEKGVKI